MPRLTVAIRLNDLGIRTNAMARIRPNISKPARSDSDLPALQDFTALNINNTAAPDHQISGRATRSNSNEMGGQIGPRFQWIFHL